MSGVTKLLISAYGKADFSGQSTGQYTAQVNPEKYSLKYEVKYNTTAPVGSSNVSPKFTSALPAVMDFELLFDGTGVIEIQGSQPYDVAAEIGKFQAVVIKYNGDIHEPNYLKIVWGNTVFPCRLASLSINYSLFAPTGNPLRARATVSFTQSVDTPKILQTENNKSPDVTHLVRVKSGDTLPQLTREVYGDSRYYLQVARFNRLINFRDLKPGRELKFPALN